MTPAARARRNLEAFIGEVLESVPLISLGQMVLNIATDDDSQVESRLAGATWHHDGVRAFVCDLAERLTRTELVDDPPEMGSGVPDVDERARATLTVMDWSTVPVEVASELAFRLTHLCRVAAGPCFCGNHRSEVNE